MRSLVLAMSRLIVHGKLDAYVAAWLFILLSLLYLATAKGVLEYGDDISMLQVTQAMVNRGDVNVPTPPGNLEGVVRTTGEDGRSYSRYGIGQSLLAIPLYMIGSVLERFVPESHIIVDAQGVNRNGVLVYTVSLIGVITTALTAAILYLVCRAIGFGYIGSIFAAISMGVGTFAWHYSRTFMSEPPSMLSILLAFYGLLQFSRWKSTVWVFLSGAAASLAILLRVTNAVLLLPIGLWLVWEIVARYRNRPARMITGTLCWVFPVSLGLVVVAVYNYIRFGSVIETGYGNAAYAFTTPLYVGLYGFIFSSGKSIFVYAPILLVGVYSWMYLRLLNYRVAMVVVGMLLLYMGFYSRFHWWYGGGAWGPRFMVVIVPLMLVGVPSLFHRNIDRGGLVMLVLLSLVSVFIQVVSVLVPYVPYEAKMEATPEMFERLLWSPMYSPVIAQSRSLISGEYPWDLAPNYYASAFLAWFQASALVCAVVWFVFGVFILRRLAVLEITQTKAVEGAVSRAVTAERALVEGESGR